jgi:hypothetical protein
MENIEDTSPTAIASFRQQILEGEDIGKAGTCKSFKLMVARMHLQIKMIAKAKTTLQGQGLIVSASSNQKTSNTEGETTVSQRKSPSQETDKALSGKPQKQGGTAPLEPSKLTKPSKDMCPSHVYSDCILMATERTRRG